MPVKYIARFEPELDLHPKTFARVAHMVGNGRGWNDLNLISSPESQKLMAYGAGLQQRSCVGQLGDLKASRDAIGKELISRLWFASSQRHPTIQLHRRRQAPR
jgi:hypothetical protein